MNKKILLFTYIIFDFVAALLSWVLFFTYRKYNVDEMLFTHFSQSVLTDYKFLLGCVVIPCYWLLLHAFVGYYKNVMRRSRLKELGTTIAITFWGALIFFFLFILDDHVNTPYDYLKYFLILLLFQFSLTYIPRVIVTTIVINKLKCGKILFQTLIVGGDKVAWETYQKVVSQNLSVKVVGFLSLPDEEDKTLEKELPCLGSIDELQNVVEKYQIEELIIAIQNGKRKYIETILSMVSVSNDLIIRIIPQTQDVLVGAVKISSVIHEPLITIYSERLPVWQMIMKRFFDIVLSLIAMIILLPIYLILAVGVKCSSRGPIFYKQERVGRYGKPFNIIKFRSMCVDAESDKPLLSSKNDSRITSFGKFLRKTHLDETPQFFNVLRGDMSLVGPRPERQYFIDQIVKVAPYYKLLQSIRPGLTSWGQVKFGYAENVEEMVERLRWDILYLENMSLSMDLKILIHTALIVFKGSGK